MYLKDKHKGRTGACHQVVSFHLDFSFLQIMTTTWMMMILI